MSVDELLAELASIPEYVSHGASLALELALNAAEDARVRELLREGKPIDRGLVLPLTAEQRAQRMLYVAKLADLETLDKWVRKDGAPRRCPDIFYRLKDHNGGKDPTAPDPATRWHQTDTNGVRHERRTCDCMGAAAYEGGFDRLQPVRFAHIYGGWINTDSMRMDAARTIGPKSPRRCFERVPAPVVGGFVVYASGAGGAPVGHIGGTPMGAPAGWNENDRGSWDALEVVDVAARSPRPANQLTTGRGWWGKDAWFIVPVMTP